MLQHKIKLCNLSYSNIFYKTLFDICADSMVAISVDVGKIVDFNENAYKALGYTREEFVRLDMIDYDICETQAEMMEHIERIAEKGEEKYFTRHKTKSGDILDIEVRAKFVEINKDKFIFCVWRDVTEILRNMKEREHLLHERKNNISDLEILRQLITLCPGCKRIRDENGKWEPAENYISAAPKHDPAPGLCPDCRKRKIPHQHAR